MSNNNGQKLAGKVAVVTGGSRGIGAAIARRLATDGASVAITYTKGADAAASVIKEIERAGGKAIAIQADAADADAVKAAIEKTVATFGRLDVLVNNAGTAIPKTFEGRIITIGSAVGERVWTPGLVPYAATKGAVRLSAVTAFCGTAQSPAAGFKSVSMGPGWTLLTVNAR